MILDDIRSALLEEGLIDILVDKLHDDEAPVRMSFGFVTYSASSPIQKDQDEVTKTRVPTIKALYTLSRHGENENTLSFIWPSG